MSVDKLVTDILGERPTVKDRALRELIDARMKGGGEVKMGKGGALKKAAKAIGEYVDPATKSIEDWVWKNMPEVAQKIGLKEVPDYIQKGFGEFMGEQAKRAGKGEMGPRDLIKAYTITRSSVNRGSLPHSTATKTGMKLPATDEPVRPEGAFAEWLGSPEGQRYLDAAQRGEVDPKALQSLQEKFSPFGMPGVLAEDMRWAAENLSDPSRDIGAMILAGPDRYRELSQSVPGIGPAKSGFMGSMLGRGDFPTLDARQLRLHTEGGGKEASKFMKRRKGEGGEEAVARLAARQDALGMELDPSLDPFYQHLVHHAVWDRVGGNQTTHEDLVRAMRGYKEGGEVRMADGAIGKNVGRGMAGLRRSREPLDPKEIQAMMLDVPAGVGIPFAEAGAEYLRGNVEDAETSAAIDAALTAVPVVGALAKPAYRAVKSGVKKAAPAVREAARGALEFGVESGAILDPRMQAIAYHGSPHKFERFDPSKIGTGEGAQSYGHGLYFAESPSVAKTYKAKLSESKPVSDEDISFDVAHFMGDDIGEHAAERADVIHHRGSDIQYVFEDGSVGVLDSEGRFTPYGQPQGHLYTVDIPDESVARMLDWDKSLEQQPAIRDLLKGTDYEVGLSAKEAEKIADERLRQEAYDWADETGGDPVDYMNNANWEKYVDDVMQESGKVHGSTTGEELHKIIMRDQGYRKELFDPYNYQVDTSETLRGLGIPGIKYLDATSRSAGEGTRNFVVFPGEEETVKILERKKRGGAVIMKSGGKIKSAADMFHAKGHQALMDFDNKTKKRKG